MTCESLSGRLLRLFLVLQDYSFRVEYRAGAAHGNADAMSGLPQGPPCPPQTLLSYMAGPASSDGGEGLAPSAAASSASDGIPAGAVPSSPDVYA